MAIASFVSMIGNQIVSRLLLQEPFFSPYAMKLYIEFFLTCLVIVVVAIPESIPLAMAIAWGHSISQMLEQNLRVKNLESKSRIGARVGCEKLAECNDICIDKTAGLTENKMTLRECYIDGEYYSDIAEALISAESRGLIGEGICVNTTTHIIDDVGGPGSKKVR